MSLQRQAERWDPTRGVAYVRVSTNKQLLGPKGQRKAIGEWARSNGIRIVRWRVEQCSGSKPPEKRRRFLMALNDLRALKAGKLVVWKRDRFARGGVIMIAAMEAEIMRQGAELVSTDNVSNGTSPEAELIRRLLDAVHAYELQMIRLRTRQVRLVKMRRGEKVGGSVPFGWRRRADGALEAEPEEAAALRLMRALRDQGFKAPTIAKALERDGVRCRGHRWHSKTVSRVLARTA